MTSIIRPSHAAGPVEVTQYKGGKIVRHFTLPAPGDCDTELRFIKPERRGNIAYTKTAQLLNEEFKNK